LQPDEAERERKANLAAFHRIFSGTGTKEDAKRVMEGIVTFCEMRSKPKESGVDRVVQSLVRDAKREVYYRIIEAIELGAKGAEAESVFGFEKSGVGE